MSWSSRRRLMLLTGATVIALIYLSLNLQIHSRSQASTPIIQDEPFGEESLPSSPIIPPESPFCADRFGVSYLENLRDSATEYCTSDSSSSLTCFHTDVTGHHRVDTFCFGRNAIFDSMTGKFVMDCERAKIKTPETWYAVPEYGHFLRYWYDTGPQVVLDGWVDLGNDTVEEPQESPSYTVVVKREGSQNLWHSLMEVFSMAMTLDVLRISQRPNDPHSHILLAEADVKNTQVVLLDNYEDGPYIELWSMLANKPTIRLADMPNDTSTNLIIPLGGGSNPFWQSDREISPCGDSSLLRTFASRALETYHITERKRPRNEIVITYIQRKESRRLVNEDMYLDRIRAILPEVTVQAIDFAAISFKQQLETMQNTDILLGIHGAGLTHTMFLPPKSAMVEIFPPTVDEQVFHNVASILGHSYFSAHGLMWMEKSKTSDWHGDDVFLEEDEFIELVRGAVKALSGRGKQL